MGADFAGQPAGWVGAFLTAFPDVASAAADIATHRDPA